MTVTGPSTTIGATLPAMTLVAPARDGSGPQRLTGRQRREQLLDVAAEVVLEGGADAATMEGVAARAGVSKKLGYAHFANRDELLLALFDREVSELDAAVAASLAGARSLEEQIGSMVHAYLDVLDGRGLLLRGLLQSQLGRGPIADRQADRQQRVWKFLAGLLVSGLGIPEVAATTAAAILLDALDGAIAVWAAGVLSRPEVEAVFLDMAMGALRALTGPGAARSRRAPGRRAT